MTITLSSVMPQLQRAQVLLQAGQAGQAWLLLAPVRVAIDRHGEALRLYALVAQAVGRIDDAIGALKRIAALEGDPPEILGAIADTFGKANRHAEAYDHWSAMIARYPEVVEAHLNRAIAAANANLHDQAVAAADEGLRRFAGDARLLATRAMALKNAGRIDESLDAFETAVAADPERALTRHNHAVALRAACRFEESCEAYAVAERLGAKGAQFHSNWAAAALEAHHVNQAEELYDKALAEDPSHEEARTGLTRLRDRISRRRRRIRPLRSCRQIAPRSSQCLARLVEGLDRQPTDRRCLGRGHGGSCIQSWPSPAFGGPGLCRGHDR